MTLVERIKELCLNKDTTLIGLERELGLGRGTIRNWDEKIPSVDKLGKVADYFNVSTDYLLGKTNIKSPSKGIELLEEKEGLYFRLAQRAKELELDEKDIDFILEFYEKHKK